MSKGEDRSPHYGDDHGDENSADDEEENIRPPWPPLRCVAFHLNYRLARKPRMCSQRSFANRQPVEKGTGHHQLSETVTNANTHLLINESLGSSSNFFLLRI